MIVVDTNTIAYFYIPGQFTSMVDEIRQKDNEWVTSPLWRFDFRSVLQKYVKANLLDFSDAIQIAEDAEMTLLGREVSIPPSVALSFLDQAMTIFPKISAYDSEFLALAKSLNLKLITFDKDISKKFPEIAISAKEYLNAESGYRQ